MARTVKCYFTSEGDPHFEPGESDVILLDSEITLEIEGDEWIFRFTDEPVTDDQDLIHIDLSTCKRLALSILHDFDTDITPDWLETASFMDFVRKMSTFKEEEF